MKLEDQVLLSFYQDISPLADNPRIMLVRHVETGQIYVRKKQRNGGYFRFFAFFFATLYPKVPSFLPSRK